MSNTETNPIETEAPADGVAGQDASEPADPWKAVSKFAHEHPAVVIAGGIATGLLVGALIPRRTIRNVSRRAVELAELAGAAGLTLGEQARRKAEAAGADLRERGAAVAERAAERIETYGEAAAERAERILDSAEQAAGKAGKIIADKASELKSRVQR